MIEEITIQGYKSIKELNNFKLNRLNVLIGANGSGKSNFLSLFELLRNIYIQNLQRYISVKGGCDRFLHFGKKRTEKIFIQVNFEINKYDITIVPNDENKLTIQSDHAHFSGYVSNISSNDNESKIKDYITEKKIYTHTKKVTPTMRAYTSNNLRKIFLYHFHDTGDTSPIKSMPAVNDNLFLKQDGANLAAYLLMLKNKYSGYYNSIVQTIRLVAPFFHDFELRDNNGYTTLEWYHKDDLETPLYPAVLSDGTLRFICLTTLLMQPPELIPSIVLIDEPELGLHPYAINILYAMLKQVCEEKQIIITTHSIELINQCSIEDIIVVDQDEGISSFTRYNQDDLKNWIQEYKYTIGELWKSNIIGGTP